MISEEKPFVIGICGGTGSGKTTVAKKMCETLDGNVLLISMDSYYKHNPEMPLNERTKINYDHPSAFDVDLMLEQLRQLKDGKTVNIPVYDFSQHLRSDKIIVAESKRVIILEGILLFAIPEILSEIDLKIFVDVDADVRILRRLRRDVKDRGRTIDGVIDQYLTTVKPMHEQFIEPSKKNADLIIPKGGHNDVTIDIVAEAIKIKVNDKNER